MDGQARVRPAWHGQSFNQPVYVWASGFAVNIEVGREFKFLITRKYALSMVASTYRVVYTALNDFAA